MGGSGGLKHFHIICIYRQRKTTSNFQVHLTNFQRFRIYYVVYIRVHIHLAAHKVSFAKLSHLVHIHIYTYTYNSSRGFSRRRRHIYDFTRLGLAFTLAVRGGRQHLNMYYVIYVATCVYTANVCLLL